jgi:hypothetical protein
MSATTGLEVRFTVFHESQGPVLAYCIAPGSTFASKAGVRFADTRKLVEALNAVGLPGSEIATFSDRAYPTSIGRMQKLGFKLP